MTGFDIIILLVVAVSALLAFFRGFVREALSMAAMFIAILAVLWGFPMLRTPMRDLIETGWVADVVTVGLIFVLVYIAVRVATGRIHEWIHDSEPLGILDRTAGLLFGVARGFVLMAVGALVVTSVAPIDMLPKSLREAKFYPLVMLTADGLKHLAPRVGQAATDMGRSASAMGKDMAGEQPTTDPATTNTLNSPLDADAQKAEESATEPKRGDMPAWAMPSSRGKQSGDEKRDPEKSK
jgi:membrane protein required for colicin V production